MDIDPDKEVAVPYIIGDRSTSDVVVDTNRGGSAYIFADRLSESWPTCQILDSVVVSKYTVKILSSTCTKCPTLLYVVADSSVLKTEWYQKQNPSLARLQPVDATSIRGIFLSTLHFAHHHLLRTSDDELKVEVRKSINCLLTSFYVVEDLGQHLDMDKTCELLSVVSDLSGHVRFDQVGDYERFVNSWVEKSESIFCWDVMEVEVRFGRQLLMVLSSTAKRLHMWVLMWRVHSHLSRWTMRFGRAWSLPLFQWCSLPSGDQAEILTQWLGTHHIQYPDLAEAFEVWCYRSKVAKRRLTLLGK
ncbi:hypothetical protein MKW92_031067 [Papaver armeniacum]|nr:hypothetical protein MKW92_031067 [Papaver armeniacum]